MSNTFGKIFRTTTWGESHGKAIGVVIDGCPAGIDLSELDIQKELDRRKPGQSKITTARQEQDRAEILSGVFEGKTLGTPISIIVYNKDARSNDYDNLKNIYRPGSADFTYQAKYGFRDWRGGGRASGRETIGRVAAGAVARKILREIGVEIVGFVKQIGDVSFSIKSFKFQVSSFKRAVEKSIVRCPDEDASKEMIGLIEKVRREGDSVGGVVEIIATGVPAGWGEPVFDKLSADIAKALMSIPGVKGVEIGSGFESAVMRGSEHNDIFVSSKLKTVASRREQSSKPQLKTKNLLLTLTNYSGGILGGISNGMPIVARIAVKPTSSIAQEQMTINEQGQLQKIKITGRHDPCICPRVVPVAEAMMALVLVDSYFISRLSRL